MTLAVVSNHDLDTLQVWVRLLAVSLFFSVFYLFYFYLCFFISLAIASDMHSKTILPLFHGPSSLAHVFLWSFPALGSEQIQSHSKHRTNCTAFRQVWVPYDEQVSLISKQISFCPHWFSLWIHTEHVMFDCVYRLGKLYRITPVKKLRDLRLHWSIPFGLDSLYRSVPEGYLSHLLGDEGEGSILSLLKELGWAENLSAGSSIRY